MIFIFDIDGTLADLSHRLHHIQKEPKDWKGFFADCKEDEPISEVVAVFKALAASGHKLYAITGRSSEIGQKTHSWLGYRGLYPIHIFMRREGDHREDSLVKSELLDRLLAEEGLDISSIAGVFEDRQQVVDMYRARGLRVFQVAPGNF